jgi:immunoglobulin-binding protein 1
LDDYEVIPASEKALFAKQAGVASDPMKRREAKIQQFKKEKEIKDKIKVRTVQAAAIIHC